MTPLPCLMRFGYTETSMAIRIPTGAVPKSAARNFSFVLGIVGVITSFFLPQYSEAVRELGILLGGLGLTLGKAEAP
jgi:4-hydroxybenzoate polyprenyltransferase